MVQIGDLGTIGSKWSQRAGQSQQAYQQGVEDSSDQEWESETLDAAQNWEQGVQQAAANDQFEAGVSSTTKSWQERAATLGPGRFSEGVRESEDEYEAGFSPYRDVIEGTNLPARGPRGDLDTNMQRSRAMASALVERRRQG